MLIDELRACRRLVLEQQDIRRALAALDGETQGVLRYDALGMPRSAGRLTSYQEGLLARKDGLQRRLDYLAENVPKTQEKARERLRGTTEMTARFGQLYYVEAMPLEEVQRLLERSQKQIRRYQLLLAAAK